MSWVCRLQYRSDINSLCKGHEAAFHLTYKTLKTSKCIYSIYCVFILCIYTVYCVVILCTMHLYSVLCIYTKYCVVLLCTL